MSGFKASGYTGTRTAWGRRGSARRTGPRTTRCPRTRVLSVPRTRREHTRPEYTDGAASRRECVTRRGFQRGLMLAVPGHVRSAVRTLAAPRGAARGHAEVRAAARAGPAPLAGSPCRTPAGPARGAPSSAAPRTVCVCTSRALRGSKPRKEEERRSLQRPPGPPCQFVRLY